MLKLTTDYTESCPNAPDLKLDPGVMNHPQSDAELTKVSRSNIILSTLSLMSLIIGNEVLPSALHDPAAWDILTQFLTSSMSMSEMDDTLVSYLGDRYHEEDWVEARHLLFSGDGNDTESLRILKLLKVKYIPDPPEDSSAHTSALRIDNCLSSSPIQKSRTRPKVSNIHS